MVAGRAVAIPSCAPTIPCEPNVSCTFKGERSTELDFAMLAGEWAKRLAGLDS